MPDAQIIHLFQREKPPTEDTEFWVWGQDFVTDGVLNLEYILSNIQTCESEAELKRLLVELRDEVGSYPIGESERGT